MGTLTSQEPLPTLQREWTGPWALGRLQKLSRQVSPVNSKLRPASGLILQNLSSSEHVRQQVRTSQESRFCWFPWSPCCCGFWCRHTEPKKGLRVQNDPGQVGKAVRANGRPRSLKDQGLGEEMDCSVYKEALGLIPKMRDELNQPAPVVLGLSIQA